MKFILKGNYLLTEVPLELNPHRIETTRHCIHFLNNGFVGSGIIPILTTNVLSERKYRKKIILFLKHIVKKWFQSRVGSITNNREIVLFDIDFVRTV
jgi:hypothetical protein